MKTLITEISENDFRKLNLSVWKKEWVTKGYDDPVGGHTSRTLKWVKYSVNDLLDKEIEITLNSGYPSDQYELSLPVTIAIHENNDNKEDREHPYGGGYYDKFMNQYLGETTYYILWGIEHLYSNRDYYYVKNDYCRIRKKETRVIYRVHLNPRPFTLKHNTIQNVWPYDFIPEGASKDYKNISLDINYDLQDDGSWKEVSRVCNIRYERSSHIIPVDENGHEKLQRNDD